MGIRDWLSGPKATRDLSLEGTRFPLFSSEQRFFEECQKSGQSAMLLPFDDFWPANAKCINGLTTVRKGNETPRLLCGSCLVDMPMSFLMALPGGFGGKIITINERPPSNLSSSAKAAGCPYCGSKQAILLWDHPQYGDIIQRDMEALRELWRFRCQLWWKHNDRPERECKCFSKIPRGEGYLYGSNVICEKCAIKDTASEALSELRKNPDYFGASELRRARNFKVGAWRLERASLVRKNEDREKLKESTLDPSMKAQLEGKDVLDHLLYGNLLATAVGTNDTELIAILGTKKIRCQHCNKVAACGVRNPTKEIQISCPTCGKPWVSLKYA